MKLRGSGLGAWVKGKVLYYEFYVKLGPCKRIVFFVDEQGSQ